MPKTTAKRKAKAKKPASGKPAKKTLKKSPLKKKTLKKKAAAKKKSGAKRKAPANKSIPAKPLMISPGPQPTGIPPVEEPAMHEDALGTVTHYYSHINVAVIQINKGVLRVGDTVHIKGHTSDITQKIDSMEYEHQHIDEARPGQSVGIKVNEHVREHDIVYLVK